MRQNLIHLLCSSAHQEKLNYSEETCILVIQLVKNMLFCHADNQTKFASYVTKLIRDVISRINKKPSISGFLHQLILQVNIIYTFQFKTCQFIKKHSIKPTNYMVSIKAS